jgi:hypothetical protein
MVALALGLAMSLVNVEVAIAQAGTLDDSFSEDGKATVNLTEELR